MRSGESSQPETDFPSAGDDDTMIGQINDTLLAFRKMRTTGSVQPPAIVR